ncbi:hypothetical protein BuS5_00801 [Desulfosarcina sp. BuS5]|uniref:hypothetical protein n=1 Tax=Desulfosarcina sp. BuS5 TaxID=933262 RepID=UPI0004856BB9|nr:hypothetical protein [Desulfosarcina sp. BuS5]WDN87833.1 hypothetical protein BuS5_00801 [Desulfosarcina sp. BuS5]
MKQFLILIEDDFEIMGNGLGNVADLQYLPALALMNIADKYNAKITFMVDVAQQLAFKANSEIPEIRVQSTLWDETVLLLKERGHDVQLHLHPQWINATYESGYFCLNDNWNIGRYDPAIQHKLIVDSVEYLTSLLCKEFPEYKVCAFKAGAWGLQPSANLQAEFEKIGIHIILGVRDGLKVLTQGIDYTDLEEKQLPYYPDADDITRVAENVRNLVVIPLQPYAPDLITFSKYILNQVVTKFRYKNNLSYYYTHPIPRNIKTLNPLKDKKLFTIGTRPYCTHLKIGNQPYSYLKSSFDAVINKLEQYDIERIPIVIESHTKQYHNHYRDVEKFIAYIAEKYEPKAEFGCFSSFSQELLKNPHFARSKNGNC